jgi:class 3 adenylate cyclase
MICPRCGASAASGERYCGDCGSGLPWRCGACGGDNAPGKRFCVACGAAAAAIPSPAAAPVAERRQLTVMFVDLVGSTALGARLDPEDLREVITAFQGAVTGVVARFTGFLARYMGDGVLVYFGYPQANEDDAERAVRAGLAIALAVGRLSTVAGPPGTLSARVGIATGLVVVGDLIGEGASLEWAVVGITPNLAARLQTMAEPGRCVIDDATQRLLGRLFDYHDLGPAAVKGLGAAGHAWTVLRERAIDSRFEALRPTQLPLINRDEEMALLMRRWQQARLGEGRVVLLSGEPGIGKSRLIAGLEERLRRTPHRRLRFVCSPHYQDTALHPVIRQLERAARLAPDDPPVVKQAKLRRLLGPDAFDVDVTLLADLLAIPGAADELPASLTPRQRKEMTFAAIVRRLRSLARRTPVLVVLEDMHWADPTTRELLELQIEQLAGVRALLVVTTRPELEPAWATGPHVTVQTLSGLHRSHASSLINEVIGDQALPVEVVERIIERADGVPLFIEEVTKTVLEHHGGGPMADVVPTSLQASLMARLDRLAASKEVAQIGAVIGREFSFDLLRVLSGTPVRPLQAAVEQLVQAGLATPRGQTPEVYVFKHALVQDAAYASLLRDRRRALHLQLAEALEASGAEPQLIAWHLGEGGAAARAVEAYLAAAERATGRYALGEMVSHLRKALHQLDTLPVAAARHQRELSLRVALGQVLIDHRGSGSEEVRAEFERARELCLLLGDTKQLLVVFEGLVLNYHFANAQPAKMLTYATELDDIAARSGDPMAALWAARARGSASLLLGRFVEARDEMQRVIDAYKERRGRSEALGMARLPEVALYVNLGICLTALGFAETGAATSLEGVRSAEGGQRVVSLIAALRRACVQRMMLRDVPGVRKLAERLLALNAGHETFVGTREGAIFHCWALLQRGSGRGLIDRLKDCIGELDDAKHWVMLPFLMTAVAEAIGERGDVGGALALLDRASALQQLTGEEWCAAETLRVKARFQARDRAEADALLQASLAKARSQGARLWELRTAVALVELWRAGGQPQAARDLLAPIYGWFTEGVDAVDVAAARALLGELGAA